jgi:hypothetical protein
MTMRNRTKWISGVAAGALAVAAAAVVVGATTSGASEPAAAPVSEQGVPNFAQGPGVNTTPGHMTFCSGSQGDTRIVARSLSDDDSAPIPVVVPIPAGQNSCREVDLSGFGNFVNLELDLRNENGDFQAIGGSRLNIPGLSQGGITVVISAATAGAHPLILNTAATVTQPDGKEIPLGVPVNLPPQ